MNFYIYDSMLDMWITQDQRTFTTCKKEAGRFSMPEAISIAAESNSFMGSTYANQTFIVAAESNLIAA